MPPPCGGERSADDAASFAPRGPDTIEGRDCAGGGGMSGKRQQPGGDVTILSAGCALEGRLIARGPVRVEGAINGALTADGPVSVATGARILGEVRVDDLTVRGKVHGIVVVRSHLQVLASGAVRGYARYATLEVERGGVVDGSATLQAEAAARADELREAAE
jgi:cytoskeletal protein CcmA (bactofilin family)